MGVPGKQHSAGDECDELCSSFVAHDASERGSAGLHTGTCFDGQAVRCCMGDLAQVYDMGPLPDTRASRAGSL